MYAGPGRYRHYKGDLYRVLGISRNKDTGERNVIYEPLNIDGSTIGSDDFWQRPFVEFQEFLDEKGVHRFAAVQTVGERTILERLDERRSAILRHRVHGADCPATNSPPDGCNCYEQGIPEDELTLDMRVDLYLEGGDGKRLREVLDGRLA